MLTIRTYEIRIAEEVFVLKFGAEYYGVCTPCGKLHGVDRLNFDLEVERFFCQGCEAHIGVVCG
jgi:transposase-like protein